MGTECVDIDECSDVDLNNCHETLGICDNTPGNYTCECLDGYEGNGGYCNNINECWTETHDCHEFADCSDTEPGFECACADGFDDTSADNSLDPGRVCEDIDECADPVLNDCGTDNAECINVDGGFNCTCSEGYEGDGKICENIDECTSVDFPHDCHANATCTDNDGSFDCACKNGFNDVDGDGRNCTDIDECADVDLNNCDPDPAEGTCVNTDQGYECGCQEGFLFQEDKPSKCLDINECFEGGHNCVDDLDGGICSNALGTFSCECAEGWTGDGTTEADGCVDDDECDLGTDTCDDNAAWSNIGGSFECECNDGWSGDGFTCEDVNECASMDLNSCDPLATCVNNDASYDCECPDGYSLNQFTNQCNDVDECANNGSNCDLENDATCQNTEGSFTCVCPTGLGGAGTLDDPCTEVLGKCDPFAVDGYVIQGDCKKKENSVCVATCDGDATPPYFLAADGETGVTMNFKCACEGDRSGDGSSLICDYELVNSEPVDGATCVQCPDLEQLTWFGSSSNSLKRGGPSASLIKSRVQKSVSVSHADYNVLLMLPGDWSQAKIFSWVYDIDSITLETDSSSTLVVMKQNANSPSVSVNSWTDFYMGFSNIEEFVTNQQHLNYRVGLSPTDITDPQCIVDINPVAPLESARRKVARAQKQAQNPERNGDNEMSKKRIADQADDETVFIPRD
jgi:hypothetical protein